MVLSRKPSESCMSRSTQELEHDIWGDVQAFYREREQIVQHPSISPDEYEAWRFFYTSNTSRSTTSSGPGYPNIDDRGYTPPLWSDRPSTEAWNARWTEHPGSSEQREIDDAEDDEDIIMDSWDEAREVEEDAEATRRRKELGFFLGGETVEGCATNGGDNGRIGER